MKRPGVTYQRSNKTASLTNTTNNANSGNTAITEKKLPSSLLNPDAALQEKINDLLQSKENFRDPTLKLVEDEFDSAYIETIGNAKKVHDLVQVGEITRFVDEIEYLLDGLSPHSNKTATIRSTLTEIIKKCFVKEGGNSFGLKLKSHGSLLRIFEILTTAQDEHLIPDKSVKSKLMILIVGLLHDVRRLDFFFSSKVAIDLAKLCLVETKNDESIWDKEDLEIMRSSQVCQGCKGSLNSTQNLLNFIGIWFLSKWTFASITTPCASFFLQEFLSDSELVKVVIGSVFSIVEVGEKAGSLIDCLLNSPMCTDSSYNTDPNYFMKSLTPEFFFKLLKCCEDHENCLSFYKVVVSLTGSLFGRNFLPQNRSHFSAVKILVGLLETGDYNTDAENGTNFRGELILSALVNLIDRPGPVDEDNFLILDDFRFQKISSADPKQASILQFLTEKFIETKNGSSSGSRRPFTSLLALLLGFICRSNKSNLEVLQSTASVASKSMKGANSIESIRFDIKSEIRNEVQCFMSTFKDEELVFRLQEIMTTFK